MIELRLEARRQAIKYEEKARKSEKKIIIKCIKECRKGKIGEEREQMGGNKKNITGKDRNE